MAYYNPWEGTPAGDVVEKVTVPKEVRETEKYQKAKKKAAEKRQRRSVVPAPDEPEKNEQLPTTPEETVEVFIGKRPLVKRQVPGEPEPEQQPFESQTYDREQVVDRLTPGSAYLPFFIRAEMTPEQQRQYIVQGFSSSGAAGRFQEQTQDYPPGTRYVTTPGGGIRPDLSRVSDNDKVQFYKQRGTFTDPQTGEQMSWQEYKSRNPAAFLVVENGKVQVVTDYQRWNEQRYEGADPTQEMISRGLARFLGGFANPEFIIETVGRGGTGEEIIARWEFERQQNIKEGDVVGFIAGIPVVTNVLAPAGAGAAFGALMRGGSAFTNYLFRTVGPKAATASNIIQKGVAGGVGVAFGVKEGIEFINTPDEKKLERLLTTGTQVASFIGGAKLVQEYQPIDGIATDKYGNIVIKKHITTFRGKPVLPYGKTKAFGVVGDQYFARVVSPTPSKGKLQFLTPEQFVKTKVQPFQQKGLVPVTAKGSSIFDIPMESTVPVVTQFNNIVTVDVGTNWQPFVESQFPLTIRKGTQPIVKPKAGSIIPIEDVFPSLKTESDLLNEKLISKDWQPDTGIDKPVSEIKTQDELFSVYKKGKISTQEYQTQRDIIKGNTVEKEVQRIFEKPKTKMVKDRSPVYPPIFMDAVAGGGIVTKQYGVTFWETGKGTGDKRGFALSTDVVRKPIVKPKAGKAVPFGKYFSIADFKFDDVFLESGTSIIDSKPTVRLIEPKKGKTVTMKDLVKKGIIETQESDMMTGDSASGQVSILEPPQQKTKVKTKKIVKQKPVIEQLQDEKILTIEKEVSMSSPLYKPRPVSKSISEKAMEQIMNKTTKQDRGLASIFGFGQGQQQKQGQVQSFGNVTIPAISSVQLPDMFQPQIKASETDVIQTTTNLMEQPFTEPPTPVDVFTPIQPKPKKGKGKTKPPVPTVIPVLPEADMMEAVGLQSNQGYDVYVKPRQYRNGKKIREGRYNIKKNKVPLTKAQARNLGHNIVDKNEKASFKLIPSGKPASKKKIRGEKFMDHILDYRVYNNGVHTERPQARIDSPGELREITYKGIAARRRGKGSNSIEKRVNRLSRRVAF